MAKKKKVVKQDFAPYYYQGEPTPEVMKAICDMLKDGIRVYHQFGKPTPPPCPPGGCA